ncbi:MAG: hypothetical protein CW691_02555 [Candidatus Bathyarchaeum sp.]|nr:MAG: hypothetical protein CW691_02555 [Candidatus Bathyarchaeum sp.]
MVKKWIEPRDIKPESDYEEAKRKFEMAMGKPFITLRLEIPTGFESFGNEFRKLETDPQFHEEVKDLIKKRLLLDSRGKKSS